MRTNTHVRVEYFFNSTNETPDRIEVYTLPSAHGNSFVMLENKMTPYYFGAYNCNDKPPNPPNPKPCDDSTSGLYGLGDPRLKVTLDNRFAATAPFPASVTCGKIKVQMYGQ